MNTPELQRDVASPRATRKDSPSLLLRHLLLVNFTVLFICAFNIAPVAAQDPILTVFAVPSDGVFSKLVNDITAGPDGNLWFTESTFFHNTIGRITPDGVVKEFIIAPDAVPGYNLYPRTPANITLGPDGNLWFTELGVNGVGQITTTGRVTEFNAGSNSSFPRLQCITAGPDGNLWFTDPGTSEILVIGRMTTNGAVDRFVVPWISASTSCITAGPDGNLWFTASGQSTDYHNLNQIVRINRDGRVLNVFDLGYYAGVVDITLGPDNNLWFTERDAGRIGRITTAGVINEFSVGMSDGASPNRITAGPDGNLWFTDWNGRIGRITTNGVITEFDFGGFLPRSSLNGITAGPGGTLWFTGFTLNGSDGSVSDGIGRITLSGGGAVNGACGLANGQTFTAAPTTNLCSSGTPTTVSGSSSSWSWSCIGSNGGSTVSCSANRQTQTWTVTPSAGAGGPLVHQHP